MGRRRQHYTYTHRRKQCSMIDPHDERDELVGQLAAAQAELRRLRAEYAELSDELKRVAAERDAVLAGKYVPVSDLSACWRVGSEHLIRAEKAEAALERVRKLHPNAGPSQGYDDTGYTELGDCCGTCGTHGEYGVPWPCATIRALDGGADDGS